MELRDEELRVSPVRAHRSAVDQSRRSNKPRHEYVENQNYSYGRCCSSPETLSRLGGERERTSIDGYQRDHRYERSIGMACVDHEIRAKHRATSTKSHERNPQREGLPLRAHSL